MSLYQQIEDFKKYANFLCESFDVQIQLDSNKAETDGKTIYLPNLEVMTTEEIDMLYSILLHEVGHIRYSDFSVESFKKIKTQWHAFLANAIEDARIENLLTKDFSGAKNMFEKLYCDFIHNKSLTKKIFKYELNEPQLFESIAFYAHHLIVNFKTLGVDKISSSSINKKVKAFYNKNDLEKYIKNHRLNDWNDVIALTNHIYALFVQKNKDISEEISLKKIENEKEKLKKTVFKTESILNHKKEDIENLEQQKQCVVQEMGDYQNERQESIEILKEKISQINQQRTKAFEQKSSIENHQKNIDEKVRLDKKEKELASWLEKNQNVQQKMQEKIESKKDGRGNDLSEEQLKQLSERLKDRKEKIGDKENSLQQTTQELQKLQDIQQLSDEERLKAQETLQSLNDLIEQTNSTLSELQKSLDKINEGMASMEKRLEQINDKLAKTQKDLKSNLLDMVYDMQAQENPNMDPSWPEAAQLQNEFDRKLAKETGQFVSNGIKQASPFGSNVRDMTVFIDKSKEKVQEINVLEIFKDQIKLTNLEQFNEDELVKNYEDKSRVGVYGTRRQHIPSTTVYDKIIMNNHNNEQKEFSEMLQRNHCFYHQLKNIFQKKLKFSKKDFWKGAQEEGRFDNRNLWKLPANQGSDFYEINNPKYINKVSACILIDISGSHDIHIQKAKELAIGLSLALSASHVKHEVLGFHAPICDEMRAVSQSPVYTRRSNNLETVVFKSFEQKESIGLMNIESHMTDNSDGEALRIALKRLVAKKSKSNLIFLISDGKPFICDTDISVLDEDFRQALLACAKQKVRVFGLSDGENMKEFLQNFSVKIEDRDILLKFFNEQLVS